MLIAGIDELPRGFHGVIACVTRCCTEEVNISEVVVIKCLVHNRGLFVLMTSLS